MSDLGNDNDQMMNYLQTDPKLERSLLSGIPPNVLREQAERWLLTARHFDPLGDWYQVVRLSRLAPLGIPQARRPGYHGDAVCR